MEENISEEVAQLQYENMKLLDELKQLKRHILSVEENYNSLFLSSSARENHVKSLEQQVYSMCEALKEKDQSIEALELSNDKFLKLNEKIKSEQLSLKNEVMQEQEMLKIKEEEFKVTYAKMKEENARLLTELTIKSEECLLSQSNTRNLLHKIKELEDEKLELVILKDNLFHRITEEQSKKNKENEASLFEDQSWVLPDRKSEIGIFGQEELLINDHQSLSLREEILEVEIKENKILIAKLQNLLLSKEKEMVRQNEFIRELKEKLEHSKLLIYNCRANIDFHPCFLDDVYEKLAYSLKLIRWPEAQSAEFKSLKEVTPIAIIVKDGIQTNQQGPIWIVETTSIASQTDPIKNLSPVVPFKSFKKNESVDTDSSDSDDELQSLSLLEENQLGKCRQIFSDHKNCDLDMDIFRLFEPESKNLDPCARILNKDLSINSSEDSLFFERNSNKYTNFNLNLKDFSDCDSLESETRDNQEKCVGKNYSIATTIGYQFNTKKDSGLGTNIHIDLPNMVTDLCKQLDFVLNVLIQLTSNAEAYGHSQREQKMLEFISMIVQHVETLINQKKKESKSPGSLAFDNKKSRDCFPRRRSANLEFSWRRQTSVITLPRVRLLENKQNNINGETKIIWDFSRNTLPKEKKLCFSTSVFVRQVNINRSRDDNLEKYSSDTRRGSDNNTSVYCIKNIDKYSELSPEIIDRSKAVTSYRHDKFSYSNFNRKDLSHFIEESKKSSIFKKCAKPSNYMRKILKWAKMTSCAVRFRWPESVFHYISFYLTWYTVFFLIFTCFEGSFSGINGCLNYSNLHYFCLWFAVFSIVNLTRRFCRILILLALIMVLVIIALLIYLSKTIFQHLSNEEVVSILRSFGLVLEVRYLNGPPPV